MGNANILTTDKIFLTRLRYYWSFWSINDFVRLGLFPSSFWWFRVAIKCWIFEFCGSIAEIKDFQMPFALVFSKSCTSSNDLLKFSHRTNFFVYDD